MKNNVLAGLLALFLGDFGIHKFYMGKIGQGICMLLFFWTGIPGLIGFIEGIIYLCTNKKDFNERYCGIKLMEKEDEPDISDDTL